LVPFPFPTSAFFAAAGVLDYPLRTFLVVVALGRLVRYGAIAIVASLCGRRFIVDLQHPLQHFGWLLAVGITSGIAITGALMLKKRFE
jgi:membrane protein DedA with SNARE-associated domain